MRICVLHGKCSNFVYAPKNEKLRLAELHIHIHSEGSGMGVRNSACLEYANAPHSYSEPVRYICPYAAVATVTHVHKKKYYIKYFSRCKYEMFSIRMYTYLHYILSLMLDLRIITDLGIIAFVYVGESYHGWGDTQ